MKKPQVSVIMPVYNGEKHLLEAIESILNQTFDAFEFIIINDGSTDNTLAILEKYSKRDSRIIIHNNVTNKGISESLNIGLRQANTPLIARMDADDISYPHRLKTQVEFMQKHPNVTVCGSALEIHGQQKATWNPPAEHREICVRLLFNSCLYHPTIIYRKKNILSVSGYNPKFDGAEDYDLWVRLSILTNTQFANIPEILLRYRTYANKSNYKSTQSCLTNKIQEVQLKKLELTPNKTFLGYHSILANPETISLTTLQGCGEWIKRLNESNKQLNIYPQITLQKIIEQQWLILCRHLARNKNNSSIKYLIHSNHRPYLQRIYRALLINWIFMKYTYKNIAKS